jgi:glycosyltransferase involved in cell wall biosynthesis
MDLSANENSTPRALIVAGLADSLLRFRGDLIRALLARGMRVHAAAPGLSADTECGQALAAWGVTLHSLSLARTGLNPLHDLQTLVQLYRLLRRIEPTHLLAYTIKPVIYGLLAAQLAHVPASTALITGLGYAFASEGIDRQRQAVQWVAQNLYRTALRGARRVVFQNPDDQALFLNLGLVRVPQCALVHGSGVNLELFAPTPLPPLQGPIQFVLIARMIREKGIHEFLEAGRLVRLRHPQTHFHLVGGIDSNPAAISSHELARWASEGGVTHHGQLADVRPILARSHVFVLPSFYREGIPRTILEAMAMGRPIITCDTPGCRETVQHGYNGYLVPPRDPRALAEAMLQFVEQPELLERMGVASRALAEEKYDVAKVNREMLRHMGLQA